MREGQGREMGRRINAESQKETHARITHLRDNMLKHTNHTNDTHQSHKQTSTTNINLTHKHQSPFSSPKPSDGGDGNHQADGQEAQQSRHLDQVHAAARAVVAARGAAVALEKGLNLLQRAALCLRCKEEDVHDARRAHSAVEPEGALLREIGFHALKGLCHGERARPVEQHGGARGHATHLRREDLGHHQPRDGAQAQREEGDVQQHGNERHRSGNGVVVRLLKKVVAQHSRTRRHADAGHHQQSTPARAVHQEAGDHRHNHLDGAGREGRHIRARHAGILEDALAEEENGVDAAELLEEHEADRHHHRPARGAAEQIANRGRAGRALGFLDGLLDAGHFRVNVGVWRPQPPQRCAGLIRVSMHHQPARCARQKEADGQQHARHDRANQGQRPPLDAHADGVADKNADGDGQLVD
eukprot:m.78959 g.78959  ORF g.78959 m.78959 type:complete len:416 (+) comp14770_c0_seq2:125-1372(+)